MGWLMSAENALFGKARLAALRALLLQPGSAWHLRQIARAGELAPAAMARELDTLVAAGILLDERQANLRIFRVNDASPLVTPLRDLLRALDASRAGVQVKAEPAATEPAAPRRRKSRRLALSAPYDWSNADIADDALIAKTAASLRFEDVAKLCAHYGLAKVRAVVAARIADPLPRAILERQLRNIAAAEAGAADERAA